MLRGVPLAPLGLAWLVLASAGCGSSSFLPPPPPELSTAAGPGAPVVTKLIDLILDGPEQGDRGMMAQLAIRTAGRAKLSLRASALQPGDPPSKQAELIREAVDRGAAGLIVEAIDAPPVIEALHRARDKGVKIVILDRTIKTPKGEKPFPVVTFASFAKAGKEIVAGAMDVAGKRKRPVKGPALLLANDRADFRSADRIAALKDAIKEAGIPLIETLSFHGDTSAAETLIKSKFEANPQTVYVFADEETGLAGAFAYSQPDEKAKPKFLLAGFMSFDTHINQFALQASAAVADRNVQGLILKAMESVQSLFRGETVADRTEVPLPVQVFRDLPVTPYRRPDQRAD